MTDGAREEIEKVNFSSVSSIQRYFGIGFVRARQIQIFILAQVEAERERILEIVSYQLGDKVCGVCMHSGLIELVCEAIRNKPEKE